MRFIELKLAVRYLRQLPKVLLATVVLVFIAAQTLVLLATSLPLDPSQRADKIVGVKKYAFTAGAPGVGILDIGNSVVSALSLQPRNYTESFTGELYLTGISLHSNFSDGKVEWQKSMSNLDQNVTGIDGFLYNPTATSNKLITTSIVGATETDNLKLLEVPGPYKRVVFRPGTFRAQSWKSNGVLPTTNINLNFDTSITDDELFQKFSALFPDGSFSRAEEPFGCLGANCLIDRNFIIAEGRVNYLKNLATPYLMVILLVLLPLLIRGGKDLRVESNKFSELGIRRFKRPKVATFRILASLVVVVNLISLLGIAFGCAVYQVFKTQAPTDFGSILVPTDLLFGGFIWSVLAAAAISITGEKRTQTFTSKSVQKNQSLSKWVSAVLVLASGFGVLSLSFSAVSFTSYSSPEVKWEAVVALGFFVVTLAKLVSLRRRTTAQKKLFRSILDRKYPLMSLIMISSLFATSLLSGIALPALALSDRVVAASESVTFPAGYFAVPPTGGYSDAVLSKSKRIATFSEPTQNGIVKSNIPFASGSGVFLVLSKVDAKKLWPNLNQEAELEPGELFLFETSIDKKRTSPEVAAFQLDDKKTSYLAHFLKAEDSWGSSYTGVFIDTVPKAFASLFSSSQSYVLMKTDVDESSINASLLDAGLDPANVSFWYIPSEGQLKYRAALFLVFSFLIGLLLSFFVVRAVNATFKREASLIKALGYSSKEIQKTLRAMLLKNFGIAMALGMVGLAFYFVRSNESVDALPEEVLMGVGAFLFASFTGLIPILFAGRIRLQVEEDVR